MELLKVRKYSFAFQFGISLGLVAAIAVPSYYASGLIGYRVVALVMLLVVSVLAMLFDILPVLVTAFISALVWNFFFIPPVFTLHIGNTEDGLMALMYFAVALINIVLTFKIRQVQKEARDKMERENTIRLYNTLLNSLSHELRTPIATVIGAVDTLRVNPEKLSRSQRDELIGEIEIAGTRLNRQVENLLNMSRLEAGVLKLKLDWCDLNELVYEVIKQTREVSSRHSIEFKNNEKIPLFRVDRGLLEQVLHNILHNAIQHTPPNTLIHITVEQVKEFCCITVADNGPGFPNDSLDSVFEKFYRLPQSTTGGTGLGLSIAKGFTEAHKGKIELANLPSGGAEFKIWIPAEASTIKLTQ